MSLPTKAKRRILLVAGIALFLVAAGSGAYLVRKHRIRAEYMGLRADGLRAAAGGDSAKAVDLLGRYIRRYPEDADALIAYVKHRPLVRSPNRMHLRDTMLVLRHLVGVRPDLTGHKRELARLYSEYGYATEAKALVEGLLKELPTDAELLGIYAQNLARMRKFDEARRAAERWVAAAPDDVDAALLYVDASRADNRPASERAKAAADAVARMKDPFASDLVRAAAAAAGDQAVAILKEAAARGTTDVKLRRKLVHMLELLDQQSLALAQLQALVADSDDPEERQVLVRRLWELGRWADVIAAAKPLAEDELKKHVDLRAMIAVALSLTDAPEAARAAAAAVRAVADQDAVAAAWAEVVGAALASDSHDPKATIDACAKALREDPNDAYLRYFLGRAYESLGEPEAAIAHHQQAAMLRRSWPAPLLRQAELYLNLNRLEPAMEAAYLGFRRSQELSAVLLAEVWSANIEGKRRGDEDGLARLLAQLDHSNPGKFVVLPEQVAALCRTGKPEARAEAIRLARAALAAPPSQSVLQRLAAVSGTYKLGLDADCYALLKKSGDKPVSVALRQAVGLLVDGKKDEALAAFEVARQGGVEADARNWELAYALLLDGVRDERAAAAWRTLVEARPADLRVQQAALTARTVQADRELADRVIERVRALSGGEGVQWRMGRARWLLDNTVDARGQRDVRAAEQASALLGEVLAKAPDAIEARFLQAKAMERLRNTAAATEQLATVVKLDPSHQVASLYLAGLLQARGDFAKAREHLDRVTQSRVNDPRTLTMTANLLAQQGDPEGAIRQLGLLREQEESAQRLHAAMLLVQNKIPEAVAKCEEMLKRPTLPAVDFAVDLYGSLRQPAEVERALALLGTRVKVAPGVAELLRAKYATTYGNPADALTHCRRATELAPTNPVTWKELVSTYVQVGDAREAEAAVARGLAAVPGDAHLTTVQARLPVLKGAMGQPALRRMAVALARSPEAEGTREVVEVALAAVPGADSRAADAKLARLRQAADQYPLNADVQMFVAERHLAARRFEEALAIGTRATAAFPMSPEPARLVATTLVAAERWEQALAFATTWKGRAARAADVDIDLLAAAALLKLGRPAAARDRLAAHVPGPAGTSGGARTSAGTNPQVIVIYVMAAALAGDAGAADAVIVPLLSDKEQRAVRTEWLVKVPDANPSPALAARWAAAVAALPTPGTPEEEAQAIGALSRLAATAGDAALAEQARRRRGALAARADLSPMALYGLGSVAEKEKDFPVAVALYERAIAGAAARGANFAVAKNNLAMVLADMPGGDVQRAAMFAADALRVEPGQPGYLDTLAHVQEVAGDRRAAERSLRAAIQADPENVQWLVRLAELYRAETPARAADVQAAFDQIKMLTLRNGANRSLGARIDAIRAWLEAVAAVPLKP